MSMRRLHLLSIGGLVLNELIQKPDLNTRQVIEIALKYITAMGIKL